MIVVMFLCSILSLLAIAIAIYALLWMERIYKAQMQFNSKQIDINNSYSRMIDYLEEKIKK